MIWRLAASKEIPHLRIGTRYDFADEHLEHSRQRFEVPVSPVAALPRSAQRVQPRGPATALGE